MLTQLLWWVSLWTVHSAKEMPAAFIGVHELPGWWWPNPVHPSDPCGHWGALAADDWIPGGLWFLCLGKQFFHFGHKTCIFLLSANEQTFFSTLAKNKQFLLQCPPAHWHVDCSLNLQYLYVYYFLCPPASRTILTLRRPVCSALKFFLLRLMFIFSSFLSFSSAAV